MVDYITNQSKSIHLGHNARPCSFFSQATVVVVVIIVAGGNWLLHYLITLTGRANHIFSHMHWAQELPTSKLTHQQYFTHSMVHSLFANLTVNSFLHKIQWHSQMIMDRILDWLSLVNTSILSFSKIILTHCGRVTQICVYTLQLCKKDDANLRF